MGKAQHRPLCAFCEEIPFQKLAGKNVQIGYEFRLKKVSEMMKTSNCPLCDFLVRLIVGSTGQSITPLDPAFDRSVHHLASSLWAGASSYSYARPILDVGRGSSFDLWNDVDYSDGQPLKRRPLKKRVDPARLRGWYCLCEGRHDCNLMNRGQFRKLQSTKLRLIDAVERTLVEISPNVRVDYAALSYVWGDVDQYAINAEIYSDRETRPFRLNSNQLPRTLINPFRRLSSIRLPRTVADALQVVRLVGLRYLWVDSICIDQSNTEEKNDLISRMTIVYRNASLTIVAAAGASADAGLPGISTCLRNPESPIKIRSKDLSWKLLPARPSLSQILEESAWNQRAWTYQEQMFSTRCLFFSESECFWTCPMTSDLSDWRESYTLEVDETTLNYTSNLDYMPKSGILQSGPPDWSVRLDFPRYMQQPFAKWKDVVKAYTARKLTNQSDIVAAIESTAAEIWNNEDMDCIRRYGLPFGDAYIFVALAWRAKCELTRRITHDMFPTWSWLCWVGSVHFPAPDDSWKFENRIKTVNHPILRSNMYGRNDIVCRANEAHDVWNSVKSDEEMHQVPQFNSDVLTLHFYTAFITAELKGLCDTGRSDPLRNHFKSGLKLSKKLTAHDSRQLHFNTVIKSFQDGGKENVEFEGDFYLDRSLESLTVGKEYTMIVITPFLDALLLEKVGQVYERIGVGEFDADLFKSQNRNLSRCGFQLGWVSIR